MNESSLIRHPIVWLRNKLLAGLALVVPLVLTFWILKFVYDFLQGMSTPLLRSFGGIYNQTVGDALSINLDGEGFQRITNFVGFLVPLLFLIALGVMATNVIGVSIVTAVDKLLLRIPIVSFIYKSLKQVIEAFKGFGDTRNFKRVVYVEYPSPGMRLIGFVTGQFFDAKAQQAMTLVFLPGALSPMTGLLIVAESSKVVDAPLSLEEAMKIVFSGGLIGPDSADTTVAKPIFKKAKRAGANVPDFQHLPKADDLVEAQPVPSGPVPPPTPTLEESPKDKSKDKDKGKDSTQLVGSPATSEKIRSFLPWMKR